MSGVVCYYTIFTWNSGQGVTGQPSLLSINTQASRSAVLLSSVKLGNQWVHLLHSRIKGKGQYLKEKKLQNCKTTTIINQ